MMLWSIIVVLALLVSLGLVIVARLKASSNEQSGQVSSEEHFKVQLAAIAADVKSTRLEPAEAEAAKSEIARELMRHRATDIVEQAGPDEKLLKIGLPLASLVIFVFAIGSYMLLGSPEVPSAPYAARMAAVQQDRLSIEDAISRVEQQLELAPDDVRGWRVLGPAYMHAGRYQEAVSAFRKELELSGPGADLQTNLAEALLMASNGQSSEEVATLLQGAADMDKTHTRSRFYLAGEATRIGDWATAVVRWEELIALSSGGEPWLEIATEGLALAKSGGEALPPPPLTTAPAPSATPAPDQSELIREMVEGLSARLLLEGGTLEEWTRLVRSQLVLGELDQARDAYQLALAAYPDAAGRADLDAMAAQAGILNANETSSGQ